MTKTMLAGLLSLGTMMVGAPAFAQNSNQAATAATKQDLKNQEKADKQQAKADMAEKKALSTKQQKKADKAQDKANKAAEKTSAPPASN